MWEELLVGSSSASEPETGSTTRRSGDLDSSIIVVVMVSGTFFLVSLVLYFLVRRRVPNIYQARSSRRDKATVIWWLWGVLKANDNEIAKKSGINAVLYLRLQKYLIMYALTCTIVALAVLVPVNVTKGEPPISDGFATTLGTNIRNPATAWLDLLCIFSFSFLGYYVIWRYQRKAAELRVIFRTENEPHSYTVKIKKLPLRINSEEQLLAFMDRFYPGQIVAVHIGYNLPSLMHLQQELRHAMEELIKVDFTEKRTGKKMWMSTTPGMMTRVGHAFYQNLCCCCWPGGRVPRSYTELSIDESTIISGHYSDTNIAERGLLPDDEVVTLPGGKKIASARSFWRKKIAHIEEEIEKIKLDQPYPTSGTAFVTFAKIDVSVRCQRDFHPKYLDVTLEHVAKLAEKKSAESDEDDDEDSDEESDNKPIANVYELQDRQSLGKQNRKIGKYYQEHMDLGKAIEWFGVREWKVKPAPIQDDILWENLRSDKGTQRLRKVFTFMLVIVLSFIVAIPAASASIIIDYLFPDISEGFRGFLVSFLPTLLVVAFQALLPVLLEIATSGEKPHSISELNHSVMRKFYMYLLWNVIIFQLLLSRSLTAVLELFKGSRDFLEDLTHIDFIVQVEYYVSYLFQVTFITGSMYMLRIGDFVFSRFRRAFVAGTPMEAAEVDAISICPFRYYLHYCEMMMVTTVMLLFSVISPLIIPVALFFFCLRHVIDKNNILKVTPRDVGDGRLAPTVLYYFCFALFIFQFIMIVWYFVQRQWVLGGLLCCLPVFTILLVVYITRTFHVYDQHVDLKELRTQLSRTTFGLEQPFLSGRAEQPSSDSELSELFLRDSYAHVALATHSNDYSKRKSGATSVEFERLFVDKSAEIAS
eukprot:TRINITY_DN1828_c0_g2_i1.p1 TRINITY_DN1828_c0_g2~~TRINITY_DN1828_c0_g2_i1.p1  ORF type:complete len:872 (+),score=169.74 TRINITY_DN1828_c0_g2_i1:196-2811(+)